MEEKNIDSIGLEDNKSEGNIYIFDKFILFNKKIYKNIYDFLVFIILLNIYFLNIIIEFKFHHSSFVLLLLLIQKLY